MPETPCLLGNQTAVFLKCAEIDCALESAKKPRTAGLCGQAAAKSDCGPLSCALIERVNRGLKLPKQGMVRRKNLTPKGSFLHRRSSIRKDLSHIAHKRCDARFKGPWRTHTPLRRQNRTQRFTRANRGTMWRCVGDELGAFWTSTYALYVDVQRRRGPAGTRSPAVGSRAVPTSFTVCHRGVEVQKRSARSFHAPCCADSIACTRCRSAVLSSAVN